MNNLFRNFSILLLLLTSCVSAYDDGSVDYSASPRENYENGEKALKAKRWVSAAKYFNFVKGRFPYSRFAIGAELGLAQAEFGAGNYLAAIEDFKEFRKLHPTHEKTRNGDILFGIASSYYKMLPGDFWLYPPSHEKDQSATYDASRELKRFLTKYPKSENQPKAKKMLAEVKKRLAHHEWYVAEFYWNRGKPMGTVLRLRRLLTRYGDSGFDAKALFRLGEAYDKINERVRAKEAYTELVKRFPSDENSGAAKRRIAEK